MTTPKESLARQIVEYILQATEQYTKRRILFPAGVVSRGDSQIRPCEDVMAEAIESLLVAQVDYRTLLERVVEAEFGFGDWPTEKELRDALGHDPRTVTR